MSESDLPADLPPPPGSEGARADWLRLIRSYRVGPATFYRLLGDHGSARAALAALPDVARSAGVKDYRPCSAEQTEAELRAGKRCGAVLIALGEPDYPAALAALDAPPPLLWMLGDRELAQRPGVALVGTRQATSLGIRMARALAEDLGRAGYTIISGLARGIDGAAHQGGLASGTIAVMPGGVDVVYPPEHAALAAEIAKSGLRVSDQAIGLSPQAQHFVRRNRIIAGLAEAVVVVEAPVRSGALITAREALDAGREVLAVPGHPFDSRVSGCNQLIRDGAILVRSAADIREALEQRGARQLKLNPSTPPADAMVAASARTQPTAPMQPVAQTQPAAQAQPVAQAQAAARAQPPAQAKTVSAPQSGTNAQSAAHEQAPTMPRPKLPPNPAGPVPAAPNAVADQRRRNFRLFDPEANRSKPRPGEAEHDARRDLVEAKDQPTPPEPARTAPGAISAADKISARLAAPAGDLPRRILDQLGLAPLSEDELSRDLGLGPGRLGQELLVLELEGQIERRPGGLLSRLQ